MGKIIITISLIFLATTQATATTENFVDLAWETSAYVPLFYQGHSQVVPGQQVKVIALPQIQTNNKKLPDQELIFEWFKDGRKLSSFSGQGKNKITYISDTGGNNIIDIIIKTLDGREKANRRLSVPINSPKIVLYEEDPLTGTRTGQAISDIYHLNKPEVTILAEPYLFPTATVLNNTLNFEWLVNNQKIVTNPDDQRLVTFVAPEGGISDHQIQVTASNLANFIQTAKKALTISLQPEFIF